VSNANAVLNTAYGINVIKYTSNRNECKLAYDDTFTYKVVDPSNAESSTSTVTVKAEKHNCHPTVDTTPFTKSLTTSSAIDFAPHISDNETPDKSNLKIKVIS
jgi:hypothetical protein